MTRKNDAWTTEEERKMAYEILVKKYGYEKVASLSFYDLGTCIYKTCGKFAQPLPATIEELYKR